MKKMTKKDAIWNIVAGIGFTIFQIIFISITGSSSLKIIGIFAGVFVAIVGIVTYVRLENK